MKYNNIKINYMNYDYSFHIKELKSIISDLLSMISDKFSITYKLLIFSSLYKKKNERITNS